MMTSTLTNVFPCYVDVVISVPAILLVIGSDGVHDLVDDATNMMAVSVQQHRLFAFGCVYAHWGPA